MFFNKGFAVDLIWLAIGFITVMSWVILHRSVVSVRQKLLRYIRNAAPETYSAILGDKKRAWLERGWYSPSDIPVLRRLHRGLISGGFNESLSDDELIKYRTLVRYRRYAGVGFFLLFIPGTALLMVFGIGS